MTPPIARCSLWLHTPRGLLILLATVVALPAATLVFLGVRLLQQDRDLERQRRAEILQEASDRVNALARDLAAYGLTEPAKHDEIEVFENFLPAGTARQSARR